MEDSVPSVKGIAPGPRAAADALGVFIETALPRYFAESNNPVADVRSGLSPYLHFGQMAAQRAAMEVLRRSDPHDENAAAFLEQLIVRRELADNYCHYCREYDRFESLPEWARKTLDEHRDDPRPHLYEFREFEGAKTHDPLWNAAQRDLTDNGNMHGYLRMYWAKKILEWSENPERAIDTAICLNDRWQLDGRDPNGYAGIMWSLGGLHDRAWGERPVYGTVRTMTYSGCARKFDVRAYISRHGEG
jgi:deoxyribodipyrimidine photo-lyase